MFQLKETKKDQSKDEKEEKRLMSLENLTNSFKVSTVYISLLKDKYNCTFKVLIKRREGSLRHIVILLVTGFMVSISGLSRLDKVAANTAS